ncbi:MAG: hypothetical protein KDA84_16970, partial [Planctomycetaceae bacterium]|nr:hypothetical protein [Planctomycetaceae bacterium]
MVQTSRWISRWEQVRWVAVACVASAVLFSSGEFAKAENAEKSGNRPVAFITLKSPVTSAQVSNEALSLQTEATQRGKQGLLFLEIPGGN